MPEISEVSLQNILDTIAQGIIISSVNGSLIKINPEAIRILRLELSRIEIGRLAVLNKFGEEWKLLRPDNTPMPLEEQPAVRALKEKRTVKNIETGIRFADGSIIWLNFSASPLVNDTGEIFGLVITFTDITAHKQAEAKLNELNRFNASLLEHSPNPIAVLNLDSSIAYTNPAWEKLTGYSRSEMIGCKIPYPYWPKEKNEEYTQQFFEAKRRPGKRVERCFHNKNGGLFWVQVISIQVKEGKSPKYFVTNYVDITKRKLAEIELQENNKFNSALLEKSPHAVIVHNPDTSIIYVSPAMEKLTGFSKKETIGKKAPYPWWPPDNTPERFEGLRGIMQRGANQLEISFQKKNGDKFWVEITAKLIKFQGQTKYMVSHLVDVTERKNMREEMEFYVKEVTRIQEEERKRISRELHDDTAQSLAYLAMELDALMHSSEITSEKIIQRLKFLKDQTSNSLQEVRRFSHELRPGVLDQLGLIEAVELLADELNARNQIKVEFNLSGRGRRLSDEEEQALFRIAQEALSNIRKHSQATQASVEIKFTRNSVKLTITDNGKGFEPSEADMTLAKGRLGLIGMKERTHLIGGALSLKSAPGKGTTVSVELVKPINPKGVKE